MGEKTGRGRKVRYSLVSLRRKRAKKNADEGEDDEVTEVSPTLPTSERRKFMVVATVLQIAIVILFAIFVDYSDLTWTPGMQFRPAEISVAPTDGTPEQEAHLSLSNVTLDVQDDNVTAVINDLDNENVTDSDSDLDLDSIAFLVKEPIKNANLINRKSSKAEEDYDNDDGEDTRGKRQVDASLGDSNVTDLSDVPDDYVNEEIHTEEEHEHHHHHHGPDLLGHKDEHIVTLDHSHPEPPATRTQLFINNYKVFQDVHVMIFVGFGFLMTFLKKYGYSAVGLNMLIAALCIQWATLCQGFFRMKNGFIHVSITNLVNADFSAAAVLISFGAVLGVTTPVQLLVMALVEVAIFATNEWIGTELFQAVDMGGSMFIHVFGAYFGLMVSLMLYRKDNSSSNEGSSYNSDLFSMIGTIFLWLFWPSFNAALAPGDDQHRAVINTYFALAACSVTAFAVSSLLSKENKFDMVHIQNATLAGGVAVGTSCDLMIHPYGAMLIGMAAGTLSVCGYNYLTPLLDKRCRLHDTCGVNNLHGMPGILAGLVGALMAGLASEKDYGYSLYLQFPARAPPANSSALGEITSHLGLIHPGDDRTAGQQAAYQLAALALTLLIAVVGGLITGLFLRLPIFARQPREKLYDDSHFWGVPEDQHQVISVTPIYNIRREEDSKC